MQLLSIFLMMDPQGKGSATSTIVMMGLMILVFWLFMIRPQAKKAKKQKEFINNLQKGDKIVTIAGIHGKVNKLNDDNTLELETSPGSYIKIERQAISMEWTANVNAVPADTKK
ncbi:MAG: preprotein translocase subunit YajC [Ferruginibacter sp.]|jgi:preprotein translocase subunit YajC|nr:preprotein translocase subunit YajC [Ferruginibacter sp.]HNH21432.1 preprotein translocase subunit YajC [Ferruginibacter sp.]HNJ95721.1 preprotein translocase subunit YajC [Ferruginibacter sp.]HNK30181.1 preprotein translocase subunit YajC [Ferruginibacter sp.]